MDSIISQYSNSASLKYYEKGGNAKLVITNSPKLGSLEDIAGYKLMSSNLVMDVHPYEISSDIAEILDRENILGFAKKSGKGYHAIISGTKQEVLAIYENLLKKIYDLKNSRPQVGCIVIEDDLYDIVMDDKVEEEEE